MNTRKPAILVLAAILTAAWAPLPGRSYELQHRDAASAAPSLRFPLGTDDLGRDRLARLLYATRASLALAAVAALIATALAAVAAGVAVYLGGCWESGLMRAVDLILSLPWLFLLLAARALLPLNASPVSSLALTYLLLALLGWAAPARVLRARMRAFRGSAFVLHARAMGCTPIGILARHILPNLRPVLLAQFWTAIPVFVLAEANLGFLGLSASEPLPTWGNLLRELQNPLGLRPECFAALALVAVTVSCFKLTSPPNPAKLGGAS